MKNPNQIIKDYAYKYQDQRLSKEQLEKMLKDFLRDYFKELNNKEKLKQLKEWYLPWE